MFVILTSKPGKFHTEMGDGLRAVETWEYSLQGTKRAEFTIAEVTGQPRVTIVEDTEPRVVNSIPSKLLARFASVDGARRELESLANVAHGYRLDLRADQG